jgi:hypothetical protein
VIELPLTEALILTAVLVETVPAFAEKSAVVDPAGTVTDAGTVRTALSSETATTAPPAGAAELTDTVQVAVAFEVKVDGEHVSEDTVTGGGCKDSEKVWEVPFNAAVTTAVAALVTEAAVALKVPDVVPAATVIEAGTVRLAALSDTETVDPPEGAALVSVTMQVLTPPEGRLEGLHCRVEMRTFEVRFRVVVLDAAPSEALTVAVWSVVALPAVAAKIALLAPAATVTFGGTVRAALSLDRVTTEPVPLAALVRVTVQLEACAGDKLVGVQATAESWAGAAKFSA